MIDDVAATWMRIDELSVWANNPRTHDVAGTAGSMMRFGYGAPAIARAENREVVAGHGRIKAATLLREWFASGRVEMGAVAPVARDDVRRIVERAEIPVRLMPLSPSEAHAYALADNQLGGAWDDDALKLVLRELRSSGVELGGLGWGPDDLAELLADPAPAGPPGPDPEPMLRPATPASKPGEVYHLGPHRVACGDSTDPAIVARAFAGVAPARMVWTDPPYGVEYRSKGAKEDRPIIGDNLTPADTGRIFRAALRIAAGHAVPGASVYVTAPSGEMLPVFIDGFRETGFAYKHCLVWVKDVFVLARSDYHYRHESVLYGWKTDAGHYFVDDRTQDSVHEVPRPKRSEDHPTMKPVELIERHVSNNSRPGEVVYDPFVGSGSTIIAAARTGRAGVGIELDPAYVDVVRVRWTDYARMAGLDPGPGALFRQEPPTQRSTSTATMEEV